MTLAVMQALCLQAASVIQAMPPAALQAAIHQEALQSTPQDYMI